MPATTRNTSLQTLLIRRDAQRKFADEEIRKLQGLLDNGESTDLAKLRRKVRMCQTYAQTLQDLDDQIEFAIEGEVVEEGGEKTDMAANVEDATAYQVRLAKLVIAGEVEIEDIEKAQQSAPAQDTSNTTANTTVNGNGYPGKRLNLPKFTIAAFDGNPLKWQEFWDAFESAIHSDSELSAVQKFQYLKEFLKGNALLLTEGYRMTEANYDTVVDMLKQRFGDKEVAIQAHFDALMSLAPATGEITQIQRVFDECEVHIRSLVALDLDEVTFGRVFAPIMKSKLPEHIRLELERRHDGTPWTLDSLRELLRNELHARRMSKQVIGQPASKPTNQNTYRSKGYQGYEKDKWDRKQPASKPLATASSFVTSEGKSSGPPYPCAFCKTKGHFPDDCKNYRDVDSRKWNLKGCCFLCLKRGHRLEDCKAPGKPCPYCKAQGKHHRSLCPKKFGKETLDSALNVDAAEFIPQAYAMVGTTMTARGRRGLAIMQTALASIKGMKGTQQVRLLFDPASTRSFGRTDVLRQIGAKQVSNETLAVAGLGSEMRSKAEYGVFELGLVLQDGSTFLLTVNSVKSISCPIQKHALSTGKYPILAKIELADPVSDRTETVQIDILIGLDVYYSLVGVEQCRMDTLVILDTKVGFIASGCIPADYDRKVAVPEDTVMMFSADSNPDQELHDMIERLWTLESIGISDAPKLTDDQLAQQFFDNTVRFDSNASRYEVRWPFKPDHPVLPTNYGLARGRLASLLRRLKREPETLQKYHEIILDQVSQGVIEDAPTVPDGELVHYIAHHCVIKPDKATTKIRIVYDASAKVNKDAPSLNDCLLRGPVYLADLCGLIMRFRRKPVGVISDIEKAFLQVGLQHTERDATRFLWVNDPSKGLTEDNIGSCDLDDPFLLAATIRHHLARVDSEVSKNIIANNYVDNVITGCNTVTDAVDYYKESKQVLAKASMNLREWYSNSEEFMNHVAQPDRGISKKVTVLGLPWDLKNDTLSCTSKANKNLDGEQVTKRSILRTTASVFDPCGYFAPITVRGKLLLQNLWKVGCHWDEVVPEEQQKEWGRCLNSLCDIADIRFPRYQGSLADAICELHVFCDAARPAYGAVAYLRVDRNTEVKCDLVFAKSRVSPVKNQTLTIPKLELTAMVIGCRMATFLLTQLPVVETYIWGDNKCAIHWAIEGESSQVYVRNRAKQIKEMGNWTLRHVPGEQNPADLLTRGNVTASQLKDNSLWWNGPHWLVQPRDNWPPMPDKLEQEDEPEQEPETTVLVSFAVPFPTNEFSSWQKLLRTTAYHLRFAYNARARKLGLQRRSGPLSGSEMQEATSRWVRIAQGPLLRALDKKGHLQLVRQLGMFRDSEGFVRCSGQLDYSDLPSTAKYPLALPKDSPINHLLIGDIHEKLMHAGTPHVLAELRQKYWIINARSQVKQVRAKCLVCRREKGGPFRTPSPAPLPKFRASQGECFSRIGIDYLGPVHIFEGKKSSKSWVCLFTCAVTRAIHLEVISDMTENQFLLALRRFMALYGKPDLIVCDNAKTFHSAESTVNQLFREAVNHTNVQGYTSNRGINWKFVVELAPWMGGFYERMVTLVKDRFKCAVQRKRLSYVELLTVCAEVASILNSRPLTYCEDEVGTEVLTPNHLITHVRPSFPPLDDDDGNDPDYQRRKRANHRSEMIGKWKRIQGVVDQFWKTWQRQYLISLRNRHWSPNNRGASSMIPQMPNIFFIKSGHPMSRYYCFPRKLEYPGSSGPLYLPSFQHAYVYSMFIQTGKPDAASALVTDTTTEWDAVHLDTGKWSKSHGLDITADLLVNSQKIYEDLVMGQLDANYSPKDYSAMLRFNEEKVMEDPKSDILIVCSRNGEQVYSCGYREADVREMFEKSDSPFFSASHVWAKIMRYALDVNLAVKEGTYHFLPPLSFLKEPITFSVSHPRSVLWISNSIFRYVKDMQLGEVHILKSATFESIVDFINGELKKQGLDLTDFHIVVLQAGVVECDKGSSAERASLRSLQVLLDKVTTEPNCPRFLICPTFPYYDVHRHTAGFSRWLTKHLRGFAPLVTAGWLKIFDNLD